MRDGESGFIQCIRNVVGNDSPQNTENIIQNRYQYAHEKGVKQKIQLGRNIGTHTSPT